MGLRERVLAGLWNAGEGWSVKIVGPMKIAIGADHAGFALKEEIRKNLSEAGHEIVDFGTDNLESTDYPDYAVPVAQAVSSGNVERGILVCSTGVGMSIAANKVQGVRAALAMNADEVQLTREHNDANVLAVGARYTSTETANELVNLFLKTSFSHGERHERRLSKVAELEAK
jgi:ribose 5-phosphate isomerase B